MSLCICFTCSSNRIIILFKTLFSLFDTVFSFFWMKEQAKTRIIAQLFFFMEGTCFSSLVLWCCCRTGSNSSQTPMVHFPPAHMWMNLISGYFCSLGDKGKGQCWQVPAWLCCSGGCTQLLLSALVCHSAVGYLVWELIPFLKSSSLPEQDFASASCICHAPCFLFYQRHVLPRSDG